MQFAALPLVGRLPGVFPGIYHRQEKIERFSWLRDRALEIVSDPTIGLALIHLPIPHPPAIYSRTRGTLTAQGRIGYLDSVVLVDRTLGVLRRTMEQSGLWDRTAVLVSADHGWRTHLWRGDAEWTPDEEAASHEDTSGVPFLLKLPEQTSSVVYSKRFNTIITRQLITGILNGQLTDSSALTGFIERTMPCGIPHRVRAEYHHDQFGRGPHADPGSLSRQMLHEEIDHFTCKRPHATTGSPGGTARRHRTPRVAPLVPPRARLPCPRTRRADSFGADHPRTRHARPNDSSSRFLRCEVSGPYSRRRKTALFLLFPSVFERCGTPICRHRCLVDGGAPSSSSVFVVYYFYLLCGRGTHSPYGHESQRFCGLVSPSGSSPQSEALGMRPTVGVTILGSEIVVSASIL